MMVPRKKPDKYKARLCACGNELKGQIADILSALLLILLFTRLLSLIACMCGLLILLEHTSLYQTYPSSLPAIYIKMPVKFMEACRIPSDVVYRMVFLIPVVLTILPTLLY